MRFIAFLIAVILMVTSVNGQTLTIGEQNDTGFIELNPPQTISSSKINISFNQTVSDLLYWRLDGTNAPPSASWNMGFNDIFISPPHGIIWEKDNEAQSITVDSDTGDLNIIDVNQTATIIVSSNHNVEIKTISATGGYSQGNISIHSGTTEGSVADGLINIYAGGGLNLKTLGGAVLIGTDLPEDSITVNPSLNLISISSQGVDNLTAPNILLNGNVSGIDNLSMSGTASVETLNLINDLTVPNGGTGASSFNARGVILGGTTNLNPLQSIANSATAGVYLRNVASGSNPAWSTLALPNLCSATNVPFCTTNNVIGFGGASTMTFDNTGFQITSRGATLSLDDTNVGGVVWNISNVGNVFSISSASQEAFEINKMITTSIFSGKTCMNLATCPSSDLGLEVNGAITAYTNVTVRGLINPDSAFIVANKSGTLRIASGADNLTINNLTLNGNLIVGGNFSAKRPYAMFSDNTTQTIAATATAYVVNFTNIESNYLINRNANKQNFTVQQNGEYLIELSAVFTTTAPNSHVEIWVQKNGRNVVRSNTRTHLSNVNAEQVVAVPFILGLNTSDNFRIMWASDSTGMTMTYTTNTTYSPEVPSIILTITKVSESTT